MSEQMWREVWNAANPEKCWHVKKINSLVDQCNRCLHIGTANPPLTIDNLFEVAEKLGFIVNFHLRVGGGYVARVFIGKHSKAHDNDTPQLALLEALWQATEHRRK